MWVKVCYIRLNSKIPTSDPNGVYRAQGFGNSQVTKLPGADLCGFMLVRRLDGIPSHGREIVATVNVHEGSK